MKKAVWILEAVLFIILSMPLAILPYKYSMKVGETLGLLLFYIWRSRRRIAIENIKNSELRTQNSELRDIAKETFRNLGRSFAEIVKIYYGLGKKIIDSVEIEGIENFRDAESKGRGVLFITGHCGNWELMAIAVSTKLSGIGIVARPIDNPYINKFIEKIREKYGNTVIYKKGALREIMKKLKEGGCVGILMDQAVLPDEGYLIDFLGRGAWTTKMPALIARRTGAAVLPAFIRRTERGHIISIGREVKLSTNNNHESALIEDTKRFSSFVEEHIKQNPSEWLWIHRRWKRVLQ
jgi:KDO2-lipid IV(A) lauroyltransferase